MVFFFWLQFLTINQGDEKAHLVPVLNTMLKLSPEETQKLQMVAKGSLVIFAVKISS